MFPILLRREMVKKSLKRTTSLQRIIICSTFVETKRPQFTAVREYPCFSKNGKQSYPISGKNVMPLGQKINFWPKSWEFYCLTPLSFHVSTSRTKLFNRDLSFIVYGQIELTFKDLVFFFTNLTF